ncbi:MAG: ABC transporter substrate-binding protein, partial [Desulfuromonadales bacterium]|nr:ABC transporter substrate-binding protein [Desulfuromonadales bacterium]NIS43621.1 ABC transporter substrate-binding protein [Desulfuromonadales bacterium]
AKVVAARNELDVGTRESMYHDIQRDLQQNGPYAVMFQQTEQTVKLKDVTGFVSG